MTIASYSDLVTAVANWTHRADLTNRIPEFIALAEWRIFNGSDDPEFTSEPLRITAMENRDTGTASSGSIAYPTGYLQTIRLMIAVNGQNRALRYRSPADIATYQSQSGDAQYYSKINGAIYVGPPTAAYTHDYYKILTPLSGSNATNWIITNAPNIYLYGTLIEAWSFIGTAQSLDKAKMNYRLFTAALRGVQNSDNGDVYGSAALAVTPG